MEKINRELLIKEISSRLPYGVKAKVIGWNDEKGEVEVSLKVHSINTDGYVYFEPNDYDVNYLSIEDCFLYLRPMSSMTEEEKAMYEGLMIGVDNVSYMLDVIDWLNKNMFDYRGLIEKGLALPAPEGMYNLK